MNEMLLLFVPMYVFTGLLMGGFGLAMAGGKIAPNAVAGFRSEKTLSNPTIWYAANRYAGKWFVSIGFLALCAATLPLLFPVFRTGFALYVGVNTVVLLASVLTAVFSSVAYSEKL